jgi:sulfur carrier protein
LIFDAGVVQWQDLSFPSSRRGFDPHHPLQAHAKLLRAPIFRAVLNVISIRLRASTQPLGCSRRFSLSFELMNMAPISIAVNGHMRQVPHATTVAQLLGELDTTGKRVAVERNGEIVPKSQHGSTELNSGDQLEIVIAVGGG